MSVSQSGTRVTLSLRARKWVLVVVMVVHRESR